MTKKLNRRDLLKFIGANSSLAFMPSFDPFAFAQGQQSGDKPKLRAVIRLQMYAGWDVLMGCDPPREKFHKMIAGNQEAWGVHWNFPSGVVVPRGNFKFNDGANAGVEQSLAMQAAVNAKLKEQNAGNDFFNNPEKGIRTAKVQTPGQKLINDKEFLVMSGRAGKGGEIPFDATTAETKWTREDKGVPMFPGTAGVPANTSIAFGPLMHQFFERVENPSGAAAGTDRYLDHMTIINGIDTNKNVGHDSGAVFTACGYLPPNVGNGKDIMNFQFKPAIEAIFTQELEGGRTYLPEQLRAIPALVPALTFTYPQFRRGYASPDRTTPLAQLYDVQSLQDLNTRTSFRIPPELAGAPRDVIMQRLLERSAGKPVTEQPYRVLSEIILANGLGLSKFEAPEDQAFGGMIDIVMDGQSKNDTFVTDDIIPNVRLRKIDGSATSNFRILDPKDLRHPLNFGRTGSWQNNLATAGMMVRKGLSRGISVSFGGHVDFLPDTHRHNDHVQAMYQGQFVDGVKRLINYLRYNNDETGRPLIETTLVIVTSDIIRGPVYFDLGVQGKSDYRNNSMMLIGGGLNHTTEEAPGQIRNGRIIGYSYDGLKSGPINYETGQNLPKPASEDAQDEGKIRYANIYASLLECYGMDKDRYFPGAKSIGILAKNKPGVKN